MIMADVSWRPSVLQGFQSKIDGDDHHQDNYHYHDFNDNDADEYDNYDDDDDDDDGC